MAKLTHIDKAIAEIDLPEGVEEDLAHTAAAQAQDNEVAYNLNEAIALAKSSPDFLAGIAMPTIFEYCLPPVFLAIWTLLVELIHKDRENTELIEEVFARLAIGLPRGFGKTTVIKLFILYTVLYTDRQFTLVLSTTATHARNILSDVADMLDEPNIKALYGDWRLGMEQDTQDVKKFGFRGRNIILAGLGAGGNVRGLNLKNSRPDLMIFEDVQTREDADSQTVSESLYKWMIGTAMKAKSPKRCLTVFIANMYPTPYSILKKLKTNSNWVKFIAGGILADGSSLWEDLQPIAQLLVEYKTDMEAGHPEIFMSEVLNDENASVNNLVNFSELPEFPFEEGDIAEGKFIVIDPSNDKHNSDAVSLGYFEVHDTNKPCAMEIVEGRFSPGDTIREAIKLCTKYNCPLVVIEANAYQYSLLYWSEFICQQLGIEGIQFIDIYSGRLSKNTRILDMFKSYKAGEIFVHPSCKSQVHMQMSGFRPLKTDNVDGILDLLTYAPKVVETYRHLMSAYTVVGQQTIANEASNRPALAALSPF